MTTSHLPADVASPVEAPVSAHARVYTAGAWSVIEIDGDVDVESVPTVPPLPTDGDVLVVFDLRRTTFMDCSGIRLMAGTASAASRRGGCVRVAGASRQVRKLVGLTGLDRFVSLFDSLADALGTPNPSG